MKLSQLAAYAEGKYHITEQRKWDAFKGFSVLCDPSTGKWAALLMREWDSVSGTMTERCDIKCGREALAAFHAPYLSKPFHMQGDKWVGVRVDDDCDEEVVFQLFDRALDSGRRCGATIVLASELSKVREKRYEETALPVRSASRVPAPRAIPQKIQEMTKLYRFGDGSMRQKSETFCAQARFMEDYEDDQPWYGELHHYFPTYHDLRLAQLRGYFTWRTEIRKGNWQPIASSLAFIYVYELLNGVGAASPEDTLKKLKEFETAYLDSGLGDSGMRRYLHRWMAEFAVIKNIRPELAAQYFGEKEGEQDKALTVLKQPDRYSDGDVFEALCAVSAVKTDKSPVITKHGDEGRRLFAELWRYMLRHVSVANIGFFRMCFGEQKELRWYPLCNAVYWQPEPYADTEYVLNENHSFLCRDGVWFERVYPRLYFNRQLLNDFLHEADRLLRVYLKTGRPLKQRESAAWAEPHISAFIRADRQAKIEAARPKIMVSASKSASIFFIWYSSFPIEKFEVSHTSVCNFTNALPYCQVNFGVGEQASCILSYFRSSFCAKRREAWKTFVKAKKNPPSRYLQYLKGGALFCFGRDYFAALAISHRAVKAAASWIAISESILRFISTPASFRPCMKVE